ncbi:radical SAM protein [Persephonella atlantica]|uniref:Radical SAM protein n=1 Tax=Persephonella atlantica TaxID=2699429 RepID=A0ABS1GHD5_9AQUI|nr:radical SAM protein [Persephonella atlantica]MBK3332308.1 radical SAM protein [Persephonella atlantica]
MTKSVPSYIRLYEEGKLKDRVEKAYDMLKECTVCPHNCRVNRVKGEKGFCKTGEKIKIASFFPHRGEEFPIRGYRGSGTIFISYCNMRCVYCQNYDISQEGDGEEYSPEEIAGIMLYLQEEGCHNINWVTPSHVVPQLLKALYVAVGKGLKIPIVYNTSSYDSIETLKLLDGVVDIYLPDIKYFSNSYGRKYSKVKNYPEITKKTIKEMFRQVGNLKTDENGIAYKGVLIRHLVLPENLSTSREVIDFISSICPDAHINIMSQYRPYYKAYMFRELNRSIDMQEYYFLINYAKRKGLKVVTD